MLLIIHFSEGAHKTYTTVQVMLHLVFNSMSAWQGMQELLQLSSICLCTTHLSFACCHFGKTTQVRI